MGIMDTLKKYSTPLIYVGAIVIIIAVVAKYYGEKISNWISSLKGPY